MDELNELRQAYEAVTRERDELRRRAEESEALNLLALAANRTLDPDEVLTVVARLSRTLLGAHYVTVNTGESGGVRVVASVGLLGEPGSEPDPLARRVVEGGMPVLFDGHHPLPESPLPLHEAEGMRAALGVPLSLFGQTIGALVIGYRRDYLLQPRDTRLALTLASHATVAIGNARLHRELAERSGELERANEELRWTTQAKERFFASISHELRTPLNAIVGYHELLIEGIAGEIPPAARTFLQRADRATRALLHLVNDVLDLSRLEVGKMELQLRPTAIASVVEDSVATVLPMAQERGLEVEVSVGEEIPILHTDPHRLRQILVNLLSNAVKFTPAGRVRVEVAALHEAHGGVEIAVADTGIGIDPADQERIFHEFEQVSGAAAHAGTGLGLPISRKLARLLGGDVSLASTFGSGSVFTLRLPAFPGAEEGTRIATDKGSPAAS